MRIPLEDNFDDIIGKAQRGLGLRDEQLATQAGVSATQLQAVRGGKFDEDVVRRLAGPLGLSAEALSASGKRAWYPNDPGEIDGFALFHTPFGGMTVNAYLAWDPSTRVAAAFDTGGDCDEMMELAKRRNLKIQSIFLTHTHTDHVFELDRLIAATRATAYANTLESTEGAETFSEGQTFTLGALRIETRLTSGHSRGGTTYVVSGLARKLAVVGDAMFAGSMGGGMVSYTEALKNNRERILTLPNDTIICPGHGPLSTVGEERKHNPFFPEFQIR